MLDGKLPIDDCPNNPEVFCWGPSDVLKPSEFPVGNCSANCLAPFCGFAAISFQFPTLAELGTDPVSWYPCVTGVDTNGGASHMERFCTFWLWTGQPSDHSGSLTSPLALFYKFKFRLLTPGTSAASGPSAPGTIGGSMGTFPSCWLTLRLFHAPTRTT